MSVIGSNILAGASGSAGGDKVYVDDVFSTFLYDGNGSTQSINNGIDLAGEGGLAWFKKRNAATYGGLWDTERGVTKRLRPDNSSSEADASNLVTSFNSNGVSISATGGTQINNNNDDYVAWTFRKAPGFFDVVTYSGSSSNQTISHSLGSVPGMIIVKNLTDSESWAVYHRDIGRLNSLYLNESSAQSGTVTDWQYLNPTSTSFFVGTNSKTGANGKNYVAYIFAHDDAQFGTDEDESIIKCGTVVTNGSPQEINLGFEPQFLILKKSSTSGSWYMIDTMRGFTASENPVTLKADSADAEGGLANWRITNTGIKFDDTDNGTTWIYMAIRRPNKPPEAGTEVFQASAASSYAGTDDIPCNFAPDFFIAKTRSATGSFYAEPRLTDKWMETNSNAAESNTNYFDWDGPGGKINLTGTSFSGDPIFWQFKRAPGFMDVVAYDGNDRVATTIPHNLTVKPEIMIVKNRDAAINWAWYDKVNGATNYMQINNGNGSFASSALWNDTEPTSSVFSVGTSGSVNDNSPNKHIALLFATLPGISKVGSYSGNTGYAVNVDCGFTAGARFILIKRSDEDFNNDWYVWDTTRGIVSGNDPYLLFNSNAAQVTNTDYIDPNVYGFTVTASAPAALNATGGTYIFLAIA